MEGAYSNEKFTTIDELGIIDPQCISQSTNIFPKRKKKGRGRRSNKQKREDKEKEKGIVSVVDFLNMTKGGKASPGDQ